MYSEIEQMKFKIVGKFKKFRMSIYDFSCIKMIEGRDNIQFRFYFLQSMQTIFILHKIYIAFEVFLS